MSDFTPVPTSRAVGTGDPPVDMNQTSLELAAAGGTYNVLNATYNGGADPSGVADSTTAIQDAIGGLPANGGQLRFPPGTYTISTALNVPGNGVQFLGSGANTTEISQGSSSQHGVTSSVTTGLYETVLKDVTVNGPGAASTSYNGVYFTTSSGNIETFQAENVRAQYFGNDGVHLTNAINSSLRSVIAQHTGNNGFSIVDGTSVKMDACYARSQAGIGYFLSGTGYSALDGCACDFGEIGYQLQGVNAVTLSGCGCEAQTTGGFQVTSGSVGVVLDGCYNINNPGIACWVTGDSTATIVGFREISPGGGATASIQVDAGSSATVIDPVYVTAPNYQGNVTEIRNGIVNIWSGGSKITAHPDIVSAEPGTLLAWNYPAWGINSSASPGQTAGTNGTAYFVKLYLPSAITVTNINFWVVTAATGTVSDAYVGLVNSSGTLVASSANRSADTALSSGAPSLWTAPLSATYNAAAGVYYAVVLMWTASASNAALGYSTGGKAGNAGQSAGAYPTSQLAAQTSLAGPYTLSSNAVTSDWFWVGLS
jgi:Pectate lyase superfamily protein